MPKRTRCSANSGLFEGACPHSEDVMPAFARSFDDATDCVEHRCVRLVEQFGAYFGVAIDAQHQLGEVVASR